MARSLAATARVLKPGAVVPAAPIGRPDTAVEAYSYRVPVAPPRRAYVRSCPCAERKHVLARTYVPNANGTFHSRFTPVLSGRRAFDAAVHVGHAARAPSSRSASSAQARPPGQKRSCGHASRWLGSSGSDPSGGGAGSVAPSPIQVAAVLARRWTRTCGGGVTCPLLAAPPSLSHRHV